MGHRAAIPAHIGAKHPDLARARHDEAEQHRDGRGLAGAVAAEQRDRRAGSTVKLMWSTAVTAP